MIKSCYDCIHYREVKEEDEYFVCDNGKDWAVVVLDEEVASDCDDYEV